jgi:hypothetical protein
MPHHLPPAALRRAKSMSVDRPAANSASADGSGVRYAIDGSGPLNSACVSLAQVVWFVLLD